MNKLLTVLLLSISLPALSSELACKAQSEGYSFIVKIEENKVIYEGFEYKVSKSPAQIRVDYGNAWEKDLDNDSKPRLLLVLDRFELTGVINAKGRSDWSEGRYYAHGIKCNLNKPSI